MGKAVLVAVVVTLLVFGFFWLRAGRPRPSAPTRERVVGPDDDPDFLRDLGGRPRRRDTDDESPPA